MLSAFGVHRFLTQEILAFSKLPKKLIIKIVAVSQHNDSRAVQSLLQKVSVKDH